MGSRDHRRILTEACAPARRTTLVDLALTHHPSELASGLRGGRCRLARSHVWRNSSAPCGNEWSDSFDAPLSVPRVKVAYPRLAKYERNEAIAFDRFTTFSCTPVSARPDPRWNARILKFWRDVLSAHTPMAVRPAYAGLSAQ